MDISNFSNTKFLRTAGFSNNLDNLNYMESLHFSWEDGIEKGNDRVGEYREENVEFIPMLTIQNLDDVEEPSERPLYYDVSTEKYMQFTDSGWIERDLDWVKREVLDSKAYIDMPNFTYFTFLNPRQVSIGFRINF